MAKTYYWLKLKKDFFKSLQMKKLRRIAGGDTYTIIYLKLQLLSLENEGYLFFEGIEDSFCEELALELDEEVENVKVTLNYLQSVGLIKQNSETEFFLNDIPCLIGKETDKAEIMRKKRAMERQKMIESGNNVTTQLPNVTNRYTEIELEKEKEIELELEKETELELEKETELESEREKEKKSNYQEIIAMYNNTCVSFPKVRAYSDARKKAIGARLKNYSLEDFREVFEKAENSSFLKGCNDRNWSATFDWMISDRNFAKILDGNFDNKNNARNYTKNSVASQLDDSYRMISEWAKGE